MIKKLFEVHHLKVHCFNFVGERDREGETEEGSLIFFFFFIKAIRGRK